MANTRNNYNMLIYKSFMNYHSVCDKSSLIKQGIIFSYQALYNLPGRQIITHQNDVSTLFFSTSFTNDFFQPGRICLPKTWAIRYYIWYY